MTGELGVLRRRALNDRLMLAERGFLDADGLPYGRWFKHLVSKNKTRTFSFRHKHSMYSIWNELCTVVMVFEAFLASPDWCRHHFQVYGPSDYRSKTSFFPGIGEAIWRSMGMRSREGQAAIQHEIWRVARAIQRVADVLGGQLL